MPDFVRLLPIASAGKLHEVGRSIQFKQNIQVNQMQTASEFQGEHDCKMDLLQYVQNLAIKWTDEGATIEDVDSLALKLLSIADSRALWLDCGQATSDALNLIVQAVVSYASERGSHTHSD